MPRLWIIELKKKFKTRSKIWQQENFAAKCSNQQTIKRILTSSNSFFKFLPFCKISKCSHKMSPVNGGAIAKNPSRPKPTISRPYFLVSSSTLLISNENSRFAQLSQMRTCSGVHDRGSVIKNDNNLLKCTHDRPTWEAFLFFVVPSFVWHWKIKIQQNSVAKLLELN